MKILNNTIKLFIFISIFGLFSCGGGQNAETKDEGSSEDNQNLETSEDNSKFSEEDKEETFEENNENSEETESNSNFAGKYNFEESLGETNGGTPIFYNHVVTISKDNGEYKAEYAVDGYQTAVRLECSVIEKKSKANVSILELNFEKFGELHLFKNPDAYKPQEKLFEISPNGQEDIDITFIKENFMRDEKNQGKTLTFKSFNIN